MDSAIVGRDEELEVVHVFPAGAREGPRGLLVEGEAGIGKTAVWRAALDEAAAQRYRVLACVAGQAEARLSFAGLSDLLGGVTDADLAALPTPQREALEVALVRRAGTARRAPDPRTVAVALRTLLVDLARTRPVVVAVDDVQWLDAATARALAFAARRLDGQRVAIVATLRAPVAAPEPLGLERVSLRARTLDVAPAASKAITLRLPATLRGLLRRQGKLSVRLQAKLRDPAGNTRVVTKAVAPRLKRR
jgi:predicted ATPase